MVDLNHFLCSFVTQQAILSMVQWQTAVLKATFDVKKNFQQCVNLWIHIMLTLSMMVYRQFVMGEETSEFRTLFRTPTEIIQ